MVLWGPMEGYSGCFCEVVMGLLWGNPGVSLGLLRVVARQFREGLKSYREAKIRGQV